MLLRCSFMQICVHVHVSCSADPTDGSYDQTVECGLEMYINSRGQVGQVCLKHIYMAGRTTFQKQN
jgi:hypothetical protein